MCREEHEGLVVTFLDMDNAWQAKCTPALASSSSSVASSVQVPSQISKNQIGTNVGHCLQLCDVRQSRFQASAMTQVSSFSSIPDLSPCSGHLDTRNSFLSLLSATPQVQSDFPHSSNVRVLSSSCPVSFSSAALTSSSISISNQHLRHDPREYNRGSGGDVCPLFPSRLLGSSQRSGGPVSHEGQDTVKPSVAHAGSVHIDARYVNFTQKGYMGSSIASSDRMPRGSNLCTLKKSPPGLSSFHHDLPSTFMSSSRVFCMNKSGDLLVSNAGLLAVVCSCHGSYMSISNFSEHSGISNVIPGYAVRMDTGETLAQWRKIYFSKLGIRVPEDNEGWEWPKEHLSTVGNPRSSASSIGGIKRSVLSDMVCTSVEPEYTRRFYDNIFAGYPYVSQNQMAGVSQNDQPGNSYHQHNIFSAGLSVIPESSLRNTVNDCVKACPSPNGYTRLKSVCQGGLCDGGQLSSKSCNIVSQSGNSFSQCVGGLLDKAQTNKNISALSVRGATSSSSIELKLGQPSEKCRSLESPVPAISSQFYYNDPLKITFQQEIDYKTSPPWETDCQQYAQFGTGLSSSSRKEKQLDLSKHSYVATNMIANIETANNDLSRHSRLSVRPTYLATSSGGMSFDETTKLPNDSHHFIPWTRHFEHHTVKSGQINIADETAKPSNTDGTVKPSDKSACVSSTNKNLVTGNTNIGSLASSETHFRLYANQMEKMGFFNRDTCANNQHSPVDGKNQLLSMVPNILDTSKLPEESEERNCRGSAHRKFISSRKIGSSMGFRPTFPTEEFLQAMPSATPDLAQHLKSVLPNKKEACFGPSKINESLRKISLVEQAKRGEMNAFHLSSRHRKLQSAGPDLKMGGSLLNLLPSEEQIGRSNITYKSSLSELTSTSFSPVLSHQYNNNVEASSSTSDNPGANLKKLTTHRNGLSSYDGETSKHCHGCHDPPAELLLQGADNQTALHGTCKICSHRGYNTRKCSCISNILSSNKESEIGETSSTRGLKKHSPSNEAISMCASGINLGCVPEKKSILLEENGMVKGLVHEELKSSISQLRDVPAKIKGDCKVMCTNEPVHGIGRRGESGAEFKDFSAENDPRSSKIDESLKGKELSNLSSECSGSTIKQVSLEVNTAGSSRVDTEDPVCESDQVADQGSTVDKCFLPCDATVSQTSSDHLSSSGKVQSTISHFSNSLYNLDSHDCINEHKERDILGKRKVESHGLICVKRKRRTKWTTLDTSTVPSGVSLSSYESPSDRGDPASLQYHLAKWRNCALSPLQRCSRKRYLDMAYDNGTTEHNSETDLKNKPDCDNLPDIVAVKKLKHDNSNEATDKLRLQKVDLNNDGAVMKSNSVGLAEADYSTLGYLQGPKMKPLVCGMYGIISGRENILRLPKIFSLSQVLKTARKCEVEPQLTSVKESKKRSLDGRFCSFGEGRDSRCKKFRQPSRSIGISLRGNDKTSSDAGWSAENKQGLDKTKTNASMSSIVTSAQFKPKFKAVRRRSLYELFMEGERFSSKHKEDSYNTSTLPEQCTYDMKTNKKLDQLSGDNSDWSMGIKGLPLFLYDSPCCVCGKSNEDQTNCLLECGRCSIRIHQACYGITRLPKSHWYCRPCSTNSVDIVCVLCGYGSGAMTQALKCHNVVKSLLKAWNVPIESGTKRELACSEAFHVDMEFSRISTRSMVHNSVTTGLFDPTVKQWIHMVCGLWTPGTRCPNVDTMSSFDVSGVPQSKANTVCVICKRRGGSCIRCRVPHCSSWFHPWCAHLKDLLRSEPEGVSNEKIGFYGRCMLHAMSLPGQNEPDLDTFKLKGRKDATCARTEGYKGRKQDGKRYNASCRSKSKGRCLVPPEQLNAWLHINRQKLSLKPSLNSSISDVEHHYKLLNVMQKEYVRYKQTKGWKQLIVYKSGIHALGLYTSQLIPRGAMVVEYVGEIVGLRVADKRENEYQSGRKLQYKSACYFFRIDKEHIVDATRKGGIARFVNHSCMPNCVAKIISMRNEKKVVFFAQRDIYPGEEITYDYHFNNEDEGKKIPCFCNSRNCRRYLN